MKDVPHFGVDFLPLMCFLARRNNWNIAIANRAIGTEFPRVFRKKSISAQSGPQLEQWPRLGQFTLFTLA